MWDTTTGDEYVKARWSKHTWANAQKQSMSWMHYEVWRQTKLTKRMSEILMNRTAYCQFRMSWQYVDIFCQRVPSRTGGGNWITNEANAFGHHCDQLVPPSFLLKDILVPCCPSFRLDLHMVPSISHLSVWFRSQLLTVLLTVPSHATNWAMYSPLHIYATSRLRWEGVCMTWFWRTKPWLLFCTFKQHPA